MLDRDQWRASTACSPGGLRGCPQAPVLQTVWTPSLSACFSSFCVLFSQPSSAPLHLRHFGSSSSRPSKPTAPQAQHEPPSRHRGRERHRGARHHQGIPAVSPRLSQSGRRDVLSSPQLHLQCESLAFSFCCRRHPHKPSFKRLRRTFADSRRGTTNSCVFASFGGIFFGYDSGYINGVLASKVFIRAIQGPDATAISSSNTSLITSILSAGTFFGALIAGDLADRFGRRWTIISGCVIYCGYVTYGLAVLGVLAAND